MSPSQPTGGELSRAAGHGRPAAPVRLVHLGLGNFFRAHQAWYTDRASDAGDWGIAAFTGRRGELADALTAQEGLYTLVTRAADGDRFDVLSSLPDNPAADYDLAGLSGLAACPSVTITVTEAGMSAAPTGPRPRPPRGQGRCRGAASRPQPRCARPRRLVAGCAARRHPRWTLTVVSCDNLPDNGVVVARVVRDLAEMVDPGLADWLAGSVSFATTMVDRITPKTTQEDLHTVKEATGLNDRAPVATEPFSEWVLSGAFPGGRPRWDEAGATFTDDIQPYEQRKLWLLNGGHSLLAYAGSARGHQTVAEAVADETCRAWLEDGGRRRPGT